MTISSKIEIPEMVRKVKVGGWMGLMRANSSTYSFELEMMPCTILSI